VYANGGGNKKMIRAWSSLTSTTIQWH